MFSICSALKIQFGNRQPPTPPSPLARQPPNAPSRGMQTFFGAQQLGQLVMAVKVLCPGIYGMACIVISTVFYNLLKTHSAADRVGIPLLLQLHGWPAGPGSWLRVLHVSAISARVACFRLQAAHTRRPPRTVALKYLLSQSQSRCSHSWRHPPDNIRSSKCTLTVFIINAGTRQGKTTQSGTNEFRMGALNHIICTVFKDHRYI